MNKLSPTGNKHVLSAGYSRHNKPLTISEKKGMQCYLLRMQTQGHCFIWIRDKYHWIQPGDLLLLCPSDPYELIVGYENPHSQEPLNKILSSDYYLMVEGDWFDQWWSMRSRPAKINVGSGERLMTIWRQIVQEKRRVHDQSDEILKCYSQILCLTIDRLIDESKQATRKSSSTSIPYRMKEYVEQHATENLTLQNVADYVGISPSRASHLFKEIHGKSIIDYAIEVRLSIARERMEYSSMTLEQIAEYCGFQSYSYFHRVFRSRLGYSPSEYRRRMQH
ncbi:AraC family transcriptional regulator [Paenibacillus sp. J2TS4]|uniref:AraC family transcriptional regulator n=1 Tax=Paenibacillus sp. J2TS4 TaxID=2807194 RepID=UPI001B028ACB|nr:AraC family transcriptional regulator [Paenibacillus sp. J2TS4]GIP31494.1 DNA-binding transcriptional regulator AraC [Paenibacillus sp. J2TS4]